MAKKYGCYSSTIRHILKRKGHDLRPIREARKIFTEKQELQICKEYFSKEKPSTYTLAKIWNCSNSTIWYIIKRNGYDVRPLREVIKIFTKKQEQQICKQYNKDKLSTITLGNKWNCNNSTIRNILMRNNFPLREISITNSTPEFIQKVLKNSFGQKCYYRHKFFPSLLERDCYIYLIKLGYKVIHNFEGRFDFLVIKNNKKVVVEFHPYDRNGLTNKQYYNQRRKLLNKYGYKDLKLVVIKDLKEIENKLIEGV